MIDMSLNASEGRTTFYVSRERLDIMRFDNLDVDENWIPITQCMLLHETMTYRNPDRISWKEYGVEDVKRGI